VGDVLQHRTKVRFCQAVSLQAYLWKESERCQEAANLLAGLFNESSLGRTKSCIFLLGVVMATTAINLNIQPAQCVSASIPEIVGQSKNQSVGVLMKITFL
jgi:hypothetical protein